MKRNVQQHAGNVNGALLPPEGSTRIEEGTSFLFEQPGDSKGEEELSDVEADMVFQAANLAMERDEETEDLNETSGEDSDADAESHQEDQDNSYESNDIPHYIRGSHKSAGVSRKRARASNLSKTSMRNQGTKDSRKGGRKKYKKLSYEFCPLAH